MFKQLAISLWLGEHRIIFICFSHIERYIVAQSLSYHLKNYGYQVWYDYDKLFIGDDGDYINL